MTTEEGYLHTTPPQGWGAIVHTPQGKYLRAEGPAYTGDLPWKHEVDGEPWRSDGEIAVYGWREVSWGGGPLEDAGLRGRIWAALRGAYSDEWPESAREVSYVVRERDAAQKRLQEVTEERDKAYRGAADTDAWIASLAGCFPDSPGASNMERVSQGAYKALDLLDEAGLRAGTALAESVPLGGSAHLEGLIAQGAPPRDPTESVGTTEAPPRYLTQGRETIDRMRDLVPPHVFVGHCILTALKYRDRLGHKQGTTAPRDAQKMIWYLDMAFHVAAEDGGLEWADPRSEREGFEPYAGAEPDPTFRGLLDALGNPQAFEGSLGVLKVYLEGLKAGAQ